MKIYEEVKIRKEDKGDINLLINILWQNRNTYLMAKEIAKLSGYKARGSCVALRKDITKLICEFHLPIISNARGFKWATNTDEILAYIQSLHNRITGIARRCESLHKIINQNELPKL
jgi:hypothetical protein